MKRLVVTAYRTENVLHSADVIVELPSEDTEINAEQLVDLVWEEGVDWDRHDYCDDGPSDFEIKGERSDADKSSLPVIEYES